MSYRSTVWQKQDVCPSKGFLSFWPDCAFCSLKCIIYLSSDTDHNTVLLSSFGLCAGGQLYVRACHLLEQSFGYFTFTYNSHTMGKDVPHKNRPAKSNVGGTALLSASPRYRASWKAAPQNQDNLPLLHRTTVVHAMLWPGPLFQGPPGPLQVPPAVGCFPRPSACSLLWEKQIPSHILFRDIRWGYVGSMLNIKPQKLLCMFCKYSWNYKANPSGNCQQNKEMYRIQNRPEVPPV